MGVFFSLPHFFEGVGIDCEGKGIDSKKHAPQPLIFHLMARACLLLEHPDCSQGSSWQFYYIFHSAK